MLKIHHVRNATMVIETENDVILVDPMLGAKGTWTSLTFFRHKPQKNPTAPFPRSCHAILHKVTHCLITHKHPDHCDIAAMKFLRKNRIPVTCSIKDATHFEKKGLNVVQSIEYWKESPFLNGTIEGIPARHGYKFIAKPMGNVMGFFIKLKDQKSIYLSSDTIYTPVVDKVLKEYHPDISVVACGSAQLDIFKPLIMTMDDILTFVRNAPGKVIANHLESLNHCPTTRVDLKEQLAKNGLLEKVSIPKDGEVLEM